MNLPEPADHERDAFCCRGCFASFYRNRLPCLRGTIRTKAGKSEGLRASKMPISDFSEKWALLGQTFARQG
jgi:hypothetical protein